MHRLFKIILLMVALWAMPLMGIAAETETAQSDDPFSKTVIKKPETVLIKGGAFIMGLERKPDPKNKKPKYIDNPPHKVSVDSFYMDKYEVTNAQYEVFCKATKTKAPIFWGMDRFRCGPKFPDHPVVGVTQANARKYAEWRGMRLPTEAEWEYAARGGLKGKHYPNGDDLTETDANCGNKKEGTTPVGSYPANGYGLYDMAGNVREWVQDFYTKDYYKNSPLKNPEGPKAGKGRIVRGGGWLNGKSCCKLHRRYNLPTYWTDFAVGFRCAKDAPKDKQ